MNPAGGQPTTTPAKQRRVTPHSLRAAAVVVALTAAMSCGYGVSLTTPAPPTASPTPTASPLPSSLTTSEVARIGAAATVLITRAWVKTSPQCPDSAGSGVHIGNGMVLTAAHVLWETKIGDPCFPSIPGLPLLGPGSEPNTDVNIFARGAIIRARDSSGANNVATLIWDDIFDDLAMLSVPSLIGKPALAWGDSRALHIGDPVIAIGYPVTGATVTKGIVSALRTVPSPVVRQVLIDLLQTDAAVNPGNSGVRY